MDINLLTIIVLIIWIIIILAYSFIPLQKFGEARIKFAGFLFLLGFGIQTLVYIEPLFQTSIFFIIASIFTVSSCSFGLIFFLDSPWEFYAIAPFSAIFNSFLISLVLFWLPMHDTILLLLIIWIIIFNGYIFIMIPLLKSLDFRKKFGILLFMIGISIETFGYFSPLVHHLKSPLLETKIVIISFRFDLSQGIIFDKIFNDAVFFIVSWIAIFTFSILSFLPDASDPDSKALQSYWEFIVIFTANCFFISLGLFWIPNIVGFIIIISILIFIDSIFIIWKRTKKNE